MDTDSFIEYIKADDICEDVAENIETRLNTSNCGLPRQCMSLPNRTNKKVIRLMKDELVGKIFINLLD